MAGGGDDRNVLEPRRAARTPRRRCRQRSERRRWLPAVSPAREGVDGGEAFLEKPGGAAGRKERAVQSERVDARVDVEGKELAELFVAAAWRRREDGAKIARVAANKAYFVKDIHFAAGVFRDDGDADERAHRGGIVGREWEVEARRGRPHSPWARCLFHIEANVRGGSRRLAETKDREPETGVRRDVAGIVDIGGIGDGKCFRRKDPLRGEA